MKKMLFLLLLCAAVFSGMFMLGRSRHAEGVVSYRSEDGGLEVFPASRPLFHIPLVELHMVNVCVKAKNYYSAQNRVIFCLEGIQMDIMARLEHCSSSDRAFLQGELKKVQAGIEAASKDAADRAKKEGIGTGKWWKQLEEAVEKPEAL